jgi:N utilization substance protein B
MPTAPRRPQAKRTKRSQARALALQALCLFDSLGETFSEQLEQFLHDSHAYADLGFSRSPGVQNLTFARDLARGTWQARNRYDQLLAQAATDWSIARMPPVDRNILRLGLHELLEQPDTPPQVAINEAVELARRFGSEDSPGFVNGVLDGLRKQLGIGKEPDSAGVPPETT